MAKEIQWGENQYGEKALFADEFIRQKEALSPSSFKITSPTRSCGTNAPGMQACTNGALTEEICENGDPAPIKFHLTQVPSKRSSPRLA